MEKEKTVKEYLEEVIKEQLKVCIENKTVPSKEVLDTIGALASIKYS